MRKNRPALFSDYFGRLYRVFFALVSMLGACEIGILIWSLVSFDFSRHKHRLYFYSYLFLFLLSLFTLLFLCIERKKENASERIMHNIFRFSLCMMLWATYVSLLDGVANGDSGVLVFIMTFLSLGALVLMHPVFYVSSLVVCCTALLTAIGLIRGQPYSVGFYLNFLAFMALAIFINAHNYWMGRKKYESEQKLKQLATFDQLIGIHNRRSLVEETARRAQKQESYLFLLTDVDDFKEINDTFGHTIGDACLKQVAELLQEAFGPHIYRFGGDEFAVICNLDKKTAAEKMAAVNQRLVRQSRGVDLHLSAGIYQTDPKDQPGTVFMRADDSLYRAKRSGKNRVSFYSENTTPLS